MPAVDPQSTPPTSYVFGGNGLPGSGGYGWTGGNGGGRFWASAELLLWWFKPGNVPPLATTGTLASGGALGPGTTTLFGGGNQNYGPRLGARFTLGGWFNCGQTIGFGAGYFFLNGSSNNFNANSSGAPGSSILARPFINAITGLPDAQLIAFPGVAGGGIRVSSNSNLQGANLNMLWNLCCTSPCPPSCCGSDDCFSCYIPTYFRMYALAGPIWLQLNENLVITEQVNDPAGGSFTIVDRFQTRNNFYGGQIGASAFWQRGRCFVNLFGQVALGVTHQEVQISGETIINQPGAAPNVQQGGLLALPTNIGTYSRDRFSVVPQLGVNVGCQVTNHMWVFGGYSFLYWSNVVRPGDQIDPVVNPTQLPSAAGPGTLVGPARPTFVFHETDFWAHGINLGVQFRW